MPFDFDPVAHIYRLDGRVLPGVTSLLESLYDFGAIPEWILDRKSQIGTDVHLACEFVDDDSLDEDSIEPEIRGYVDAYRRFLRENDVKWTHVEHRAYHSTRFYAGTLDREGFVNGDVTQLDLKTVATLTDAVGVQLAGYVELRRNERARAGDDSPFNPKRQALQLMPTGKYRLVPFASPDDLPCFLSLLTLNVWKARHAK